MAHPAGVSGVCLCKGRALKHVSWYKVLLLQANRFKWLKTGATIVLQFGSMQPNMTFPLANLEVS
jgi:hypothetical protein